MFKGETIVFKILLSRCLKPKLRNNFWSSKETLSDIVNWRVLLLKYGLANEIYSGPTCKYSAKILFLE